MHGLPLGLILVLALMPIAAVVAAPAADDVTTARFLCETVKPVRRPAGAPRRSDVGMRLFRLQKEGIRTADNLIAAGKSFHITRGEWSYIRDKAFIDRCRGLGWLFQGTMNAITRDPEHAIKDKQGKPVLDHFNRPGRYMADPNNEAYRKWYLEELKKWFALGVHLIQRDEPSGLGGLGGLRRWHYDDADRFFTLLHKQAGAAAGRPIRWSCNLAWNRGRFGGKGEKITKHFDYGMSEIWARSINPRSLAEAARDARRRGKTIVYTGGHDLGIATTRQAIAGCYSVGLTFIVPWDQFGGVNKDRIFAKPADLSDLYGFVRAVAPLLDDYVEAAAILFDRESKAPTKPLLRITGGTGKVSAVVRVKPGDRQAPVVVHLIDWGAKPKALGVGLDTDRFFGGKGLSVKLISPVAYDAKAHAAAEEQAAKMLKPGQPAGRAQASAYAALRNVQLLETSAADGWTQVQAPALHPWALLEISPKP